MLSFLLLPGFRLKNNDSENERSSWFSGTSKLGSAVSELEGVLGQDDVEVQGRGTQRRFSPKCFKTLF